MRNHRYMSAATQLTDYQQLARTRTSKASNQDRQSGGG